MMLSEDDNQIMVSETYEYGENPNYVGTIFSPSNMIFAGWDQEISCVMGDMQYNAIYTTEALVGDVNGDGVINTRDVAMLRQYVVGVVELTYEQLLRCNVYEDYDADGLPQINTRDVAILQQYVVG